MRPPLLSLVLVILALLTQPAPRPAPPLGDEVTAAQMAAVHEAYRRARADDFSETSLVALYKLANAAAAVKKLVDAEQSNPSRCITKADSFAMEATRDRMNQRVLDTMAEVTGGTVEVLNFGKQNGIRSDKDQTIYATDGKRYYTATEMKALYESTFESQFGIDLKSMDMTVFDGDACIPDWRRVDLDLETHKMLFRKGQAMMEQDPSTYREAGTFRAEVDGRSSSQGRVRITKFDPETGKAEVLHGDAADFSSRYENWTADVPYRNAMDVAVENKGKFDHADDLVDRMKYFNRTVGNGLNALALENWDKNYIFHLHELKTPAERREFIRQMVADTMTIDASPEQRAQFVKVIELAAQIEIDKMDGRTRSEAEYLRPVMEVEERNARSRGEQIGEDELVRRARGSFHAMQTEVMNRNIALTTRQKILKDFDPGHLKLVAGKYGVEQARKLRWETSRQIRRAFEKLDPEMTRRIIADAPEHLRPDLESLREVAELRRAARTEAEERPIRLRGSDERAAKTTGPEEALLAAAAESFVDRRKREASELAKRLRSRYADFDAELRSGRWSDAEVTKMIRERVLDELGFEERRSFEDLDVSFKRQFNASKLLSNVVTLGNVSSLLSCIQVWQQTGDLTQVAQTALWELVCNIPGVSQLATLKQSFNDGNVQGLTWLFIAWQMPAAGQVKLVFDIAANTLRVIYDHAMTPLANDRFSQVYMGYVAKQPAGWSPLVPGWKERRDAVGDSILKHVPGESFAEKRTNMYEFFQAKLDEKLRRSGIQPTSTDYWEKRDRVLDAFFGSYVDDWFDAKGDFSQNTTAGIFGLAGEADLKKKLVTTLKRDFLQSEINFRKMEIALDELREKVTRMEEIGAENVAVERSLLASGDFVAEEIRKRQDAAFAAIPAAEPSKMKPRVEIEAYPRFVLEGQEARISVKAVSAEGEVGGRKHRVIIQKVESEPVVRGETNARDRLLRMTGEADAPQVKELADELGPEVELFVTKLLFDVIVESPDGEMIEWRTVDLNLAAGERRAASAGDTRVMIRVVRAPEDRSRGPWTTHWEEPSPENCVGGLERQNILRERLTPCVWVRWPDMPAHPGYGARVVARGGVPPYERETWCLAVPERDFGRTEGALVPGNGFILTVPLPNERTAGEIEVSGELLAFAEARPAGDLGKITPLARHPFRTSFRFHVPPDYGDALVRLGEEGFIEGKLRLKDRQSGDRIVEISAGGSRYFKMMEDGGKFRLPGIDRMPAEITVRLMDYGTMTTVALPVVPDQPRKEYAKPSRARLEEHLKRIELLKANDQDDRNADSIAYEYGQCAGSSNSGGRSFADFEEYRGYKLQEIAWRQKLLDHARNPNWSGWTMQSMGYEGQYFDRAKTTEERNRIFAGRLDQIRYGLALAHLGMANVCTNRFLADEATRHYEAAKAQVVAMTIDRKLMAKGFTALANLATKSDGYAEMTFHTTGDIEAASRIHEEGNAFFRRAEELENKPVRDRRPFRFREDPQFAGGAAGSGS